MSQKKKMRCQSHWLSSAGSNSQKQEKKTGIFPLGVAVTYLLVMTAALLRTEKRDAEIVSVGSSAFYARLRA